MKVSNSLNYMLSTGEGYRNIHNSSNISSLSEVINFEVNELCNEDIFYFMKNNYTEYNYDDNIQNLINYTLIFIANLLKTSISELKCVWLANYQDVIDKYMYNDENDNIIKVYIHENKMIPISDLGSDGALFIYTGDLIVDKI